MLIWRKRPTLEQYGRGWDTAYPDMPRLTMRHQDVEVCNTHSQSVAAAATRLMTRQVHTRDTTRRRVYATVDQLQVNTGVAREGSAASSVVVATLLKSKPNRHCRTRRAWWKKINDASKRTKRSDAAKRKKRYRSKRRARSRGCPRRHTRVAKDKDD